MYVQVADCQNILKLRCWPLSFTSNKAFLKHKERSGASLPASFPAWFFMKNISQITFYQLIIFHCPIFFSSINLHIGRYLYCNYLFPSCDVINFEINLNFLNKPFLTWPKMSRQKRKMKNERSTILNWNKKHCSSLLKNSYWSK